MLGEGDKSSFQFDDCYLFALGVLFVLTCESLFLTLIFLGGHGEVSGVSER